jgi:molybdate transport system substrate-binding protein
VRLHSVTLVVLVVSLLGALVGVLAGCALAGAGSRAGSTSATPDAAESLDLTVYAAASLRDALAAIEPAYQAAVPGINLTIATDSSATLRTQIEQGAPADLFLSADEQNPQALVDAGLADGGAIAFASARLAVIVPSDNPAGISSPADLARPDVTIVAAGDEVPISAYTQQVVARLASLPGYPVGFAAAYAANVVSKEENVKAVVAKIELGEADAAIVYSTDARSSSAVKAIDIPRGADVTATYAGVVLKATSRATEAHAFLDWLAGPGGAAILANLGFGAAP